MDTTDGEGLSHAYKYAYPKNRKKSYFARTVSFLSIYFSTKLATHHSH